MLKRLFWFLSLSHSEVLDTVSGSRLKPSSICFRFSWKETTFLPSTLPAPLQPPLHVFLPGLAFESLLPWSSTALSRLCHQTFFLGVTGVARLTLACCSHPALLTSSEKPFYVLGTHAALFSFSKLLQRPIPNCSMAYITFKTVGDLPFSFQRFSTSALLTF